MDSIKTLTGVYRAIVKDNKDPLKQERVRVEIQTIPGQISDWVWPMQPAGVHTPAPAVGQGVWIEFLASDPEYPVYFGEFGKHQDKSKKILLNPLQNSVSITGLTPYLIVVNQPDGTQEVDLIASLLAVAAKLKNHESRLASVESQLATLHTTLATRTSPSHTHGSNG